MGRPRPSLTLIVRDEEHALAAGLESVTGVCGEVVDARSNDRTREVAAGYSTARGRTISPRHGTLRSTVQREEFRLDANDRFGHSEVARHRTDISHNRSSRARGSVACSGC